MKYLLFFGFLITPLMLLNYVVMPELDKLKDFYSNVDTISQEAAGLGSSQN
jgi:hypothetical protein